MYPQSMFLSKSKENIKHFLLNVFNFYNFCISHGRVFVMSCLLHLSQTVRQRNQLRAWNMRCYRIGLAGYRIIGCNTRTGIKLCLKRYVFFFWRCKREKNVKKKNQTVGRLFSLQPHCGAMNVITNEYPQSMF